MPSVDLARLTRQVEHLRAAVGDPVTFRSRFGDLMGVYADRTRRAGVDVSRGHNVPAHILKVIANALVEETESDGERAALLADVLWSMETKEARLIAVVVLHRQPPADLLARVLAWSDTTDDPEVLGKLADDALAPVRARQPGAFLEALADVRWHFKHRRRAFGLRVLRAAVEDRQFQALPRVLELMVPRGEAPIAEERRALNQLAEALARRTPGETARWLGEALERRQAWCYAAVAAALPALPERARRPLERSLMAVRAAGIIPNHND
jgi:DNA alkylation repair enzyme